MDSSTSDPTPLLNDHSNNATSKQASPRSGGDAASTPAELTAVVDQLLENLQSKFGAVSADMLSKSAPNP